MQTSGPYLPRLPLQPVSRTDDIYWILQANGHVLELSPEIGQYCESTPDARGIQVWQEPPFPEFQRAALGKFQWSEIAGIFTAKEAYVLDTARFNRHVSGGSGIRSVLLLDGFRQDLDADEFIQSTQDEQWIECWRWHISPKIPQHGRWVIIDQTQMGLVARWPARKVVFNFTDALISVARERHLLADILG